MTKCIVSLHEHFRLLDRGISDLLAGLPLIAIPDRDAIREYIDHDEYGLALEILAGAVSEQRIPLRGDQVSEIDRLTKLMAPDDGAQ